MHNVTDLNDFVRGLLGAFRYLAVVALWLALLLIRPRLAIDIFRHRRPDSPIPRLWIGGRWV
jgi:hypothetical protein